MQTGHTKVFGSARVYFAEQEQNILLSVESWTWVSRPMTASYFVGVEVVVIVLYLAKKSLPASIGGSAKDVEFGVLNTGNSLPSFHKSRNASQLTDY